MASRDHPLKPPRYNVLTLDGGGVRGLSSLLILQDLMRLINSSIRTESPSEQTHQDVQPHDVFHFVAGTSTGGLIAIMLAKLGMDLAECEKAFYDLSKFIFDRKRLAARITRGLAPTKYSGSRLESQARKLITDKKRLPTMPMFSGTEKDRIACAVVCREHSSQSQYSALLEDPVTICSLQCPEQVACLVTQAARATSAAPTFFPVQKIGTRYFVDGGMEHNNPSEAIFDHCTKSKRAAVSNDITEVPELAEPIGDHDGVDYSQVRFVNLGTGTKTDALPPRHRDRFAQLLPAPVRMAIFLKRTLTEFAVGSERTAWHMRNLSYVSRDSSSADVSYVRFSADTGVCYIKMDKHKALGKIARLTREYLDKPGTKASLEQAARGIAKDYLRRRPAVPAPEPAPDTNDATTYPAVPPPLGDPSSLSGTPPQIVSMGALKISTANKNDPASRQASSTNHEGDPAGVQKILGEDTNRDIDPAQGVPSRMETGHLPADAIEEQAKDVADLPTITT